MMIGQRKITPRICRASRTCAVRCSLMTSESFGFNVQPGWIAQTVHETLESNKRTIGKNLSNVITDNDYK